MVEPRFVVPVVVGSSPIIHPIYCRASPVGDAFFMSGSVTGPDDRKGVSAYHAGMLLRHSLYALALFVFSFQFVASAMATVQFEQGRLSVHVASGNLETLLNDIGRKAGFEVVIYGGDVLNQRQVQDDFDDLPVEKALRRLLGKSVSFSVIRSDTGQVERLVILAGGHGAQRTLGAKVPTNTPVLSMNRGVPDVPAQDDAAEKIRRLGDTDISEDQYAEVFGRLLNALQSGKRELQLAALDAIASLGVEPPLTLEYLRSFIYGTTDDELQMQAMDVLMLYDEPAQLRNLFAGLASNPANPNAALAREYLQQLEEELGPEDTVVGQ